MGALKVVGSLLETISSPDPPKILYLLTNWMIYSKQKFRLIMPKLFPDCGIDPSRSAPKPELFAINVCKTC